MEPIEYARLIRRRWRVVAACCLISAVVVWVVTPAKPTEQLPEYVAEHTLVRDAQESGTPQALASVSLFMKAGDVPSRVAKRIGFTGPPGLLARSIAVDFDEVVGTLTIKATAKGRVAAAEVANAFAEETLAYLGERAVEAKEQSDQAVAAKLSQHQAAIDDLTRRIAAAKAAGESPVLLEAQREARLTAYGGDLVQQQQRVGQPAPTAGYVSLERASPELATLKNAGFGVPTSRPVRTAGAALIGAFLGVLLVLVVERVDPRIHLRGGAERAFRLPVVVEVPFAVTRPSEILTVSDSSSGVAEAYRALRASLLLIPPTVLGEPGAEARRGRNRLRAPAQVPTPNVVSILGPAGTSDRATAGNGHSSEAGGDKGPQVVLVTSAAPSEGKTATVANLAASFAEAGRSVLVLSCDFRRPSIHEYLGVREAWGLTEVLNGGPAAPTLTEVVKDTVLPGVRIATNGSPLDNFGEVSAAGQQLVADARGLADIVLIDTPPLLVAHEATELIPAVDSVVVLCRSGHTTKEDAGRARDLLTRLGTPVAGVVLVGAPESDTSFSTYYYRAPDTHRRPLTSILSRRARVRRSTPDRPPVATEPSKKRAVT